MVLLFNFKEKSPSFFEEKSYTEKELNRFITSVSLYTPLLSEDPDLVKELLTSELAFTSSGFLKKPEYLTTTPPPTPSPGSKRTAIITYTILDDDTLSKIAQKFGLKTKTIIDSNSFTDIHRIKPGEEILIPPVDGLIYEVRKGDALNALVKKYEGNLKETKEINDLEETLKIGQKIVIAGGKAPQAPPPKTSSKLAKESKRTVVALESRATGGGPTGSFKRPVSGFSLSQGYRQGHRGIDLDWRSGTTIYAADGGRVVSVSRGWSSGYGNHIIIDHGNGFQTFYGHLSGFSIKEGDIVSRGDVIGTMGSTGWATGVHLHFEIHKNGVQVNPFSEIE